MYMKLSGKNLVGFSQYALGNRTYKGFNPVTLEESSELFYDATPEEVSKAMDLAYEAFSSYGRFSGTRKAEFLEAIADEIEALGDELIRRVTSETGLPEARCIGERGRTTGQLRMFAGLLHEGSWVEASIDTVQPEREPVPKPDLRKMLTPVGPVAVFSASNFPLAFSVAGGDTASALAAGNPVVVKAHPSHPGTSEMVATAIQAAARKTHMPEGVFSMIHGNSYEPGKLLVLHPHTKSVGFTGSLQGGKALFDLANSREIPIPVFAEMGSTNPVFILEKALEKRPGQLASQLAGSVNLGVGQFCTKPGLIFVKEGKGLKEFLEALAAEFTQTAASSMLNERIASGFMNSVSEIEKNRSVKILGKAESDGNKLIGKAVIATVSANEFEKNPRLHHEVFGPFSLVITCPTEQKMHEVAKGLEGQLTLTVMAEDGELSEHSELLSVLQEKAGRLIRNGVPTGVEVCPSMQHGGPFPATTDARFTSVGTSAIKRFARPVAWQNWPDEELPPELQSGNPLNIWRMVDNVWTRKNAG